MNADTQNYPLIGSIQNSVGMGFIGNQAAFAVANSLGVRVVSAQTSYASAHSAFAGRSTFIADATQLRKDVAFVIARQPAVLIVGYVPRPNLAEIISRELAEYKGVVLLDPVIGDYKKGLYVTHETAAAIRDYLLPVAQIVTPNRFEAEVLLGATGGEQRSPYGFLNGMFDLGPKAVAITSFERDAERRRLSVVFTNGYNYYRINAPFYPTLPAYGVGDVFSAGLATFVAMGGSPFAGALLATVLCARAVANTSSYGGGSIDPIAALEKWKPLGYQVDDDRAMTFAARSTVEVEAIKPGTGDDGARLRFAPNRTVYG